MTEPRRVATWPQSSRSHNRSRSSRRSRSQLPQQQSSSAPHWQRRLAAARRLGLAAAGHLLCLGKRR
jgi:hypothetical protein